MSNAQNYPVPDLWYPHLESTLEKVLRTQVQLNPQFTQPRWRPALRVLSKGYAAIIHESAPTYTVRAALWLPGDPLSDILLTLTGEKGGAAEHQSAVCEFLNMIYGGAKTALTNQGFQVPLAIPKMADTELFNSFSGEELQMSWPPRGSIRMRLSIEPK